MLTKKYAVISLSGGMDSSTLLLKLLSEGYEVTALSFDYGQKHKVELERAIELVKYVNQTLTSSLKLSLPFNPIKHQVIKLDGLSQLLNSTLVEGGSEVPEGHYAEENMKDTVVPNRNKIFSSIIQAVALSIADKNNAECAIAMGIHAGDHAIYPDCRQEFRDVDFEAFKQGNWGAEKVIIYTPYLHTDKFGILQDGEKACEKMGLNFDEIYARTNTSYKPIFIPRKKEDIKSDIAMKIAEKLKTSEAAYTASDEFLKQDADAFGVKTGAWYSDYKSASSVERIEAFINLGRKDPVEYADETGPVSWETAKSYVETVLKEHINK